VNGEHYSKAVMTAKEMLNLEGVQEPRHHSRKFYTSKESWTELRTHQIIQFI